MKTIVHTNQTDVQTANTGSKAAPFFRPEGSGAELFFAPSLIQPKLEIGKPDDPYEKQADRVADAVVHSAEGSQMIQKQEAEEEELQMKREPILQRKCKECEEEDHLQMKPKYSTKNSLSSTQPINRALRTNTRSENQLSESVQTEMSQKIGADFSNVSIHTDSKASEMSQNLGARAFTYGKNIYFNSGEFNPSSKEGKHLLAHELTHVVQQNSMINKKIVQRSCSQEDQTQYDEIASDIRQLELYRNVPYHHNAIYSPAGTRRVAERIIRRARNRDNCLYYIQHLHTLFSTPEAPASSVSSSWGPVLEEAAEDEEARLQDSDAQQNSTFEEDLSGDPNRQWTRMAGQDGKIYYVDATDQSNIFVKVKVKLTGDQQRVDQAKQLEDGIEKEASILGYTVDLEFVDTSGSDVFEAEVDPSEWPTSGNWVGNIEVMAHELHHLLNLDDRYNYIESHADNEEMYVANRIHWFRVQFNRPEDPNRFTSFMGEGNLITDEDICTVIQAGDVSACVNQRSSLRSSAQGDKGRASAKVQRLIEIMSGIVPPSLLDPRGDSTTLPNAQARLQQTAELIFNAEVSESDIQYAFYQIRNFLLSGRIYLENTTAPGCNNENAYSMQNPLTFVVCPGFSQLSEDDKQKELVRVAYRMYQKYSVTGQRSTIFSQPLNPDHAQNWSDFVFTGYGRI